MAHDGFESDPLGGTSGLTRRLVNMGDSPFFGSIADDLLSSMLTSSQYPNPVVTEHYQRLQMDIDPSHLRDAPSRTPSRTHQTTNTSRQRPGVACKECRRRKLRCDGVQPQCGVCVQSGATCEISTERASRGPKKGYIKALRNRVGMLT